MRGKILTGMLIMGVIVALANFSGGLAYFSDVERSTGNTFQAGTWQSASLAVDTSRACATGCSSNYSIDLNICDGELELDVSEGEGYSRGGLHLIMLWNKGEENIAVDEIQISWFENEGENVTSVLLWDWDLTTSLVWWEGAQPSGSILNIDDFTLEPRDSLFDTHVIGFLFDDDMRGKKFTLRFIMEDSSSKEMTFQPDNCFSC